jgi:predicted DsbA family dithiol-disulfide isomerase
MPEGGLPWREFAVEKFGGEERMRAAFGHVAAAGEPDGARFDFDRVASAPNTMDAHRLILWAAEYDLQWPAADALFEAYFAGGAGLDAEDAREYLAGEDGVGAVWAGQEEAGRLGVMGVPFYVFDGRYALSGAQPVGVFVRALDAVLEGCVR